MTHFILKMPENQKLSLESFLETLMFNLAEYVIFF